MIPELEDAHRPPEPQPDTVLEGLGVGSPLNKPGAPSFSVWPVREQTQGGVPGGWKPCPEHQPVGVAPGAVVTSLSWGPFSVPHMHPCPPLWSLRPGLARPGQVGLAVMA